MILPALADAAEHRLYYSLFPPLGLATLAGYLSHDDVVALVDEHVEAVDLDDEPDLVVIQVYVTSARRSYELADRYRARGAHGRRARGRRMPSDHDHHPVRGEGVDGGTPTAMNRQPPP